MYPVAKRFRVARRVVFKHPQEDQVKWSIRLKLYLIVYERELTLLKITELERQLIANESQWWWLGMEGVVR